MRPLSADPVVWRISEGHEALRLAERITPDGHDLHEISAPSRSVIPRSEGVLKLAFKRRGEATVLGMLFQSGCLKARLLAAEPHHCTEAVLLNTAGGMTGGDRLSLAIHWGVGSQAAVTTQACEKLYRAAEDMAKIQTVLEVEEGASAEWLPQETIVFDRASLERNLLVRLGIGATFTGVEGFVLGRAAMGEYVHRAHLRDGWRIWRGSRLIYADAFHLNGDLDELLARAPVLQGRIAFASLLHAGPKAEAALDVIRALLPDADCIAGASAWNGLLAVRFVASSSASLRRSVIRVLNALRPEYALPRVWQM